MIREPRNQSEFDELAQSIKHLEKYGNASNNFNPTLIREMELSHYARCLLYYVKQVLNDGLQHKDTCYARYASNYIPLGFLGELDLGQFLRKNSHSLNEVGNLCKKLLSVKNTAAFNRLIVNDNWLFMHSNDYFRFRNGVVQRLRTNFKKLIISDRDRIFSLINAIEKNGWSDEKAYNSSGLGVLGYSMSERTYMVFHGKHRIVALKYLVACGKLSPDTEIRFPVLEYDFKHFRQSSYRCFDACKLPED